MAQYTLLREWRKNPNRTYNTYPFGYSGYVESIDFTDLKRLMDQGNDTPASWEWIDHYSQRPLTIPGIRRSGIATGGYINNGKVSIPKFETGINSVPVDMLAMLHKNEAVVPANMNPFNPNANNATMGGGVYNITNNISGYDGNLEQLSSMVTQKTITAIKGLDSRNAAMTGAPMTIGVK